MTHPRLRSGAAIFEHEGALVVRGTAGAFRIEPAHRAVMERVLTRLDGLHDFEQLLGAEEARDAFYALRLLSSMAEVRLVVDGPYASLPRSLHIRLDGTAFALLNAGSFASLVSDHIASLGGTVAEGTLADAVRRNAIGLLCPDSTNLEVVHATNREAMRVGAPWMAVLPFGDAVLTTPVFRPPYGPCFRCTELRWLGIHPSIELERAYLGGERNSPTAVVDIASALAGLIAVTALEDGTSECAPLLAFPSCDVCGSLPESQRPSSCEDWTQGLAALPLNDLAPKLEPYTQQPCGLVWVSPRSEQKSPTPGDVFAVAVTRFAIPEPESVTGAQTNWCHGSGRNPEEARTIAIVEALERYCGLSQPPPGVAAAFSALRPGEALRPSELPLFSEEQYRRPGFPFRAFQADLLLHWSYAFNVTRKRPVLVPSSAAWYGYHDEILADNSSGVAAHSGRGHALLNGLLEVIERDAFMLHWLHRLSPPQIEWHEIADGRSRAILQDVESSGYAVRLLDLTTDLEIPVVVALAYRTDRQKPALILGAGAALRITKAIDRAVSELYAATFAPTSAWTCKQPLDIAEVRELADHSRAYEHPAWLQHAEFLWASDRRSRPDATTGAGSEDDLTQAIKRLEQHGHDVIAVDLTTADVAPSGLHVVRAIVPGLQPLGSSTGGRLGGRRLYEAPVRMGYNPAPACEEKLNRIPHCFP